MCYALYINSRMTKRLIIRYCLKIERIHWHAKITPKKIRKLCNICDIQQIKIIKKKN